MTPLCSSVKQPTCLRAILILRPTFFSTGGTLCMCHIIIILYPSVFRITFAVACTSSLVSVVMAIGLASRTDLMSVNISSGGTLLMSQGSCTLGWTTFSLYTIVFPNSLDAVVMMVAWFQFGAPEP